MRRAGERPVTRRCSAAFPLPTSRRGPKSVRRFTPLDLRIQSTVARTAKRHHRADLRPSVIRPVSRLAHASELNDVGTPLEVAFRQAREQFNVMSCQAKMPRNRVQGHHVFVDQQIERAAKKTRTFRWPITITRLRLRTPTGRAPLEEGLRASSSRTFKARSLITIAPTETPQRRFSNSRSSKVIGMRTSAANVSAGKRKAPANW